MAQNNKILIDIDSDFEEGKSKDVLLYGRETLKNWILNLFTTSSSNGDFLGERPYEPTYGANLERYLFDPVNEFTALDIGDSIYDAITTFLPEFFITRSSIIVTPNQTLPGYVIVIVYIYQGETNNLKFTVVQQN